MAARAGTDNAGSPRCHQQNVWVSSSSFIVGESHSTAKDAHALAGPCSAGPVPPQGRKSRGGYTLIDPATDAPLARLKPIPQTDCFELFYWSLVRERWRTFGDFGRLSLTLDRAHEIFRNEAVFHVHGRQ
jgi:hypothetical protein